MSQFELFSFVGRFLLLLLDTCLILHLIMEPQKTIDYHAMFSDLVKRCNELTQRRNEIDGEVTKLKQLILATFPLLPDDKQAIYQTEIEQLEEESGGLLSAIKLVFSAHKGEWLTPSNVRDYLRSMGFDLTQYRANPLASIGTTLKRMVPEHLESTPSGSGTLYRRRITLLERMGQAPLDPNLFPEYVRGLIQPADKGASHPADKIKPPKAPLTPGEAKRMMETLRVKK